MKQNNELLDIILNKKFNCRSSAGYDPDDVDTFFDYVIENINELLNKNNTLEQQIETLKTNIIKNDEIIKNLKEKNNKLQSDLNMLSNEGYGNLLRNAQYNKLVEELNDLKKKHNNIKVDKNE